METFEAIQKRRSVKCFDPKHQMSADEIEKILSNAVLSPTSFNIQNWRIVHVTEPSVRQKIQEASWNQVQVTEASMLLILCADLNAWAKNPGRYWEKAPKEIQDMLVPAIGKFYKDNEQLQRDEAMRSTGLIGQTLMLEAKAMGYDSCPMVGFDPVKVGEIIGLPEDHVISFMVVIGKAVKEARGRGGQLPLNEVVFENHF